MLEIRVDLHKYSYYGKRGLCNRKDGIGFWYNVCYAILLLSIISNFGTQLIESHVFAMEYKNKYNIP